VERLAQHAARPRNALRRAAAVAARAARQRVAAAVLRQDRLQARAAPGAAAAAAAAVAAAAAARAGLAGLAGHARRAEREGNGGARQVARRRLCARERPASGGSSGGAACAAGDGEAPMRPAASRSCATGGTRRWNLRLLTARRGGVRASVRACTL